MLPLPDLDDRTFKQIIEDSGKMIPRFIKEWTDENYHDPGITLIELFAWLSEMQNYYLNRVTGKNELKFLKLLGVRPEEQVSAKADVTFEVSGKGFLLPRGTGVSAGERCFETDEAVLLTPVKIEKIISYSDGIYMDYSPINDSQGTTFYPFGKRVKAGSALYVGFDNKFEAKEEFCITFDIYEDYPVGCSRPEGWEKVFNPPADVSWEFRCIDGQEGKSGWKPVRIIQDSTVNMCFGGKLKFELPAEMASYKLNEEQSKERYWIRCMVKRGGYENAPRLKNIKLNTVLAVQRQTFVEYRDFSGDGEPVQVVEAEGYLPYYGTCRVQVKNESGSWMDWNETEDLSEASSEECCYMLKKNAARKTAVIMFGDGNNGRMPVKGDCNIRVISWLPSFEKYFSAGSGTGLPNQFIMLDGLSKSFPVIKETFMLQVGIRSKEMNDFIWEDWQRADDFDSSKNSDRHYMIDSDSAGILFGNNEKGIAPEKSEKINIRIISCQAGGGEKGNVNRNEINIVTTEIDEALKVLNHAAATGGKEKETIDDAKRKVRRQLKKQSRAVTCQDYEEIVRNTPGLRVARAKAIPLYEKGLKNYPDSTVPAKVTVVVLPYSEEENPVPGRGFLDTVKNHLEGYRLITTEIDVIPPEYIKITVHVTVVVAPHVKLEPHKIEEVLYGLIDPVNNSDVSKGWEFGRTVYKGDIYSEISKLQGVEYIKDLWISAEGEGIRKDASGDIYIPPYGLVYSDRHQIETVSRMDI